MGAENRIRIILEADGKSAEQSIQSVQRALGSFSQDAGRAASSARALGDGLSTLEAVAVRAAEAFALYKLADYAQTAVLAAARYETLGIAMHKAGENAGYSVAQMDAFESKLESTGISLTESREALTRMAAANMDLAKSADLARAAQDLAIVGQIDSSEAFNRLVYGIQSGQVEILRTIGLNVDFEASYNRLATSIGKSVQALDQSDKMHAREAVALEAAARYAGLYELSMASAGKQIQTMNRLVRDLGTLSGELGLATLGAVVFGASDSLKDLNARLKELHDTGELGQMGRTLGDGIRTMASAALDAAVALGVWYAAMRSVAAVQSAHAAITALTAGVDLASAAMVNGTLVASQMGRALLAMAGGPWVLGLSTAAFAVYKLATAETDADRVAKLHADSLKEVNRRLGETTGSARELASAMTGASAAQLKLTQVDLQKKADETAALIKSLRERVTNDLNTGDPAEAAFSLTYFEKTKYGLDQLASDIKDGSLSALDAAAKFETLRREIVAGGDDTGAFGRLLDDASKNLRALAAAGEGLDKLTKRLGDVAEAMGRLNTATAKAGIDIPATFDEARRYVANLPEVKIESENKTFESLRSRLQTIIDDGRREAADAQVLLTRANAEHQENLRRLNQHENQLLQKADEARKEARAAAIERQKLIDDFNAAYLESSGDTATAEMTDLWNKAAEGMAKIGERMTETGAKIARAKREGSYTPEVATAYADELQSLEAQRVVLQETLTLRQGILAAKQGRDERSWWAEWRDTMADLNGVGGLQAKLNKAWADGLNEAEQLQGDPDKYWASLERTAARADKAARDYAIGQAQALAQLRQEYAQTYGSAQEAAQAETEVLRAELAKRLEDARGNAEQIAAINRLYAQKLADAQARADGDRSYAAGRSLEDYARTATDTYQHAYDMVMSLTKTMEDAMVQAATKGKVEWGSLFDTIEAGIARTLLQENITGPLAKSLSGALKGGGSDSGLFGWLGNLFSFNAHGNIYDSAPGLSAYRNTFVDRPTPFLFAKGAGIMGEAGMEGIFPVRKMSNGDLGVQGVGGGGQVTVNVINNADNTKVSQRKTQTPGGGMQLDVIIEQVESSLAYNIQRGGTPLGQSMEKTYGFSRGAAL